MSAHAPGWQTAPRQPPTLPESINTSQSARNISPNTAPKCIYSVNIYLAPAFSTPLLQTEPASCYFILCERHRPRFQPFRTSQTRFLPKVNVNKLLGVGLAVALASLFRPCSSVGWKNQSFELANTSGGPGGSTPEQPGRWTQTAEAPLQRCCCCCDFLLDLLSAFTNKHQANGSSEFSQTSFSMLASILAPCQGSSSGRFQWGESGTRLDKLVCSSFRHRCRNIFIVENAESALPRPPPSLPSADGCWSVSGFIKHLQHRDNKSRFYWRERHMPPQRPGPPLERL